jgi:L-ascorbate metabolism protein UlaG (beta-lactamase superfamily)
VIEPALADDAFLADVARAPVSAVHLWWIGQSGFLVKHRGRFLLLDPYLSDSLTRKYEDTEKPHVRMTRRLIDPARLDFVDVVTASHGHTDHLDPATLHAVAAASPRMRLVCPVEIAPLAHERSGLEPTSLREGERVRLRGFELERVPAAHEELSGEFTGFVVTAGNHRIYHAGDTVWNDAIVERLRRYEVSVALLPINGRAKRGVAGNLNGREAARLAHAIGAHIAVPMHFEMFEFNTATPEEFVEEATRLGQNVVVLRAGERLTLATP